MPIPQKILVATDFSVHSQRAVAYAADLAARLGASLTIVHVVAPPAMVAPEAFSPAPSDQAVVLERARGAIDDAQANARRTGVEYVDVAILTGDPWHEIVKAARDRASDLVVVGTHGHGAVMHFLLGSVAEKVVRKAHCPVLVAAGKRD